MRHVVEGGEMNLWPLIIALFAGNAGWNLAAGDTVTGTLWAVSVALLVLSESWKVER